MGLIASLRRTPPRASVLIFSLGMMVITGTTVVSWIGNINQMQHTAARDQARIHALAAAEAGIEQVVDFFNNPGNYTGYVPPDASLNLETSPFANMLEHNIHPDPYLFFEPYVLRYSRNGSGLPVDRNGEVIVDNQGNLIQGREPVVTHWTFLTDLSDPTSSRIPTMEIDISDNDNLVFTDEEGRELARVTSIHLVAYRDIAALGDPVPLATMDNRPICKVISTATTPRGVTMRVETLLAENRFTTINAPGAIVSAATARFKGQVNVYWGEVWARADAELISNWTDRLPKSTQDPWFAYRTNGHMRDEKGILYLNGRSNSSTPFSANPIPPGSPHYNIPLLPQLHLALNPSQLSQYQNRTNIYQQQGLDFPDYSYGLVKDFFVSNGVPTYFQTPDGQIAGRETDPRSRDYGQIVKKSFSDWFGISPSHPDYWNSEKMLTFIDTIPTDADGNIAPLDSSGIPIRNATYRSREPRADGRNVTTITGATAIHTRGAMFIYGNIDFKGQGNAGGVTHGTIRDEDGNPYFVRPNGTVPSSNEYEEIGSNASIGHNGLLAVSGAVRNGGNRSVYGSIFAGFGFEEDDDSLGFTGSGSRTVYYNWRMRNGDWLNINQSVVRRSNWNVRRDDPTQVLAGL